ncbi:hypothetical protein PGB90_007298 [Kerria lacca]
MGYFEYIKMWRTITVFWCFITVFANEQNWWKNAQIYEVFVPSFKDSNGDGIGDIKGIMSKMDHFVKLGVDAVWISPIFESPLKNAGYDPTNYTVIEPKFGTLEDFDNLMSSFKKKGIKVILDFVINHSSDEHLWFQHSINKTNPYTDYYIWEYAKGYDENGVPIPPNNWMTATEPIMSAWTWNKKRKQFYYHKFSENQPDLNLRNKNLRAEIQKILQFWLAKGISGIRLDSASYFIEDDLYKDEPKKNTTLSKSEDNLLHIHTQNQQQTYEFIHELRKLIDDVNKIKEGYKSTKFSDYRGKNFDPNFRKNKAMAKQQQVIIDEFGSFFGNIDVNTHNLYEEFQTFRVLAEALRMALSDKAPEVKNPFYNMGVTEAEFPELTPNTPVSFAVVQMINHTGTACSHEMQPGIKLANTFVGLFQLYKEARSEQGNISNRNCSWCLNLTGDQGTIIPKIRCRTGTLGGSNTIEANTDVGGHAEYDRGILITETDGEVDKTMAYYGNSSYKLSDISFNIDYMIPMNYYSSSMLDEKIKSFLNNLPTEETPYWLFDNHKLKTYIPKFHENYADIMNILIMLLPGISITSYGQEIGMMNAPTKPYQKIDVLNVPRKPMQWKDSINAGFTAKSHPWLPINPNYWKVNVQTEELEKESHYQVFKTLSEIRKTKTIKNGNFHSYKISQWVYAFTRTLQGGEFYVAVFNLGSETNIVNLHDEIEHMPLLMKVRVASINAGYKKGNIIKKKPKFPKIFVMRPLSAIVLSGRTKKNKIDVQHNELIEDTLTDTY